MVWTCSLIRPHSRWRFLSSRGTGGVQQSHPNMKHRFAAEGSSDWTHEGNDISTPFQIITPNLPFGIAISGINFQCYKGSHELLWYWEHSTFATLGFIVQVTPKNCKSFNHNAANLFVQLVMWWSTGRSVGVKALDSSVERLWFNLQSTSRQFLLSLQSNIPQCLLV